MTGTPQPYKVTMSWQQLIAAVQADMTALYNGSGSATGANPTASVGTAAVNGSATTFMRSDAAPAISQAIAPTWTAGHIFSPAAGTAVTVNAVSGQNGIIINSVAASLASIEFVQTGQTAWTIYQPPSSNDLRFFGNGADRVIFNNGGGATHTGPLGVNGATPPAQVTGWGTPTGAAVVANFNGAAATLVNCSTAIAELITILKAAGFIGA